jgi:hypothetical protein
VLERAREQAAPPSFRARARGALCITLPASADTDVAGGLLVGSGKSSHDSKTESNLYQLQFGGFAELVVNHIVLGFHATRSLSSPSVCDARPGSVCFGAPNLRAMGGDLGYEWDLSILHLSPRLGVGSVRVPGSEMRALYFDPGAVLDVKLGLFMAGVDVRYRLAVDRSDWNGLLVFARIALRL